ncbi:TolC family protein [bacterium]|nr:TolC family protein [bacterium]
MLITVCAVVLLSLAPIHGAYALDLGNLTLAQTMEIAIAQNLHIEAESYTLASSRASVLYEQGKFDPTFKFTLSHSTIDDESPTSLEPTNEENFRGDMSLELNSPYGTTYEFRLGTEWVTTDLEFVLDEPYYESEVAFILTRPLLRGYGEDIPTTGIRMARNNLEISRLQYDDSVYTAVASAIEAYWELFFARADLDVARKSLELAQNLLKEVRNRIRAGKLASLEVFKAEAEVAKRQESLIRARKAVSDTEDMLREVMNLREWDIEIVPADIPPEPVSPMDLGEALQLAFEKRPDYRSALLESKNKVELRKYYENQKRSQLDLFATVSSNSVDDQIKDVPWAAFPLDTSSWSAGLNFSKPLGGREAEGQYARAMSEESRARVLIEVMAQRVRLQVREAWRNVTLAMESVDATIVTKVAADRSLRAEEEKFRVGKATLNDVLEFQAEFASALSSEKRSRADYAIALANLATQTGTLLDTIE